MMQDPSGQISPVLLDANALLLPFQFGIQLESEIKRLVGAHQIWIPGSVTRELASLDVALIKAARELAGRFPTMPVATNGDDAILELAVQHGAIVVTNDLELRKRLKDRGLKVLVMRQMSRLEWDIP